MWDYIVLDEVGLCSGCAMVQHLSHYSNGKFFKITFVIAHRIADRILQKVECNWIAKHLYSSTMNPNTNKPIDIWMRPTINEY